MMQKDPGIIEILLVEDNPGDVRLVQETLKEGWRKSNLSVVRDGEQAVDFLHQERTYTAAPRPSLILLDLNLPKKNGHEVLEEIKSDERLKHIPIVILTASKADADIQKSYAAHANCYLTKPADLDGFFGIMEAIENFWLSVVSLPRT